MAVVTPELKSFVTKFADLWHSGKNASLSLECGNGEATINLELRLGSHPLQQPQHHQRPQHCFEIRAGPSHLRRLARLAQARELAAEASASSSTRANNPADQAALTLPPRAEKVVQFDVLTLPVEKGGPAEHPSGKVNADAAVLSVKNAAVQVDQDSPGIPQMDGPMPSNDEWSCKCCMYETFYQTEDELEKHHDETHSFIEYRECNVCYNGHVWT